MFVWGLVRFSEEQAREAIAESRSWSEALRRLRYRAAGGNQKTLQKYAKKWGISTDHFDQDAIRTEALRRGRIPTKKILVERSSYGRGNLKARLYDEGLEQPACELCGQGEMWRGSRMALILDHINGVYDDNRIENLRILCPNCAATLETHCGRKNLGTGLLKLQPRECLHCGRTFMPKYRKHRYCSRECGSRWDRTVLQGGPRPELRKIERPSYEQLLVEVGHNGCLGTGRKYGVSDNAIRKWVRAYERERAIAEGRDVSTIEIPTRTWPNMRKDA